MNTRLVRFLASTLEPAEREAVLGDLAETSAPSQQALRDLASLAARRQWELWQQWQPWAILTVIVIPLGASLGLRSGLVASLSVVKAWNYGALSQLSDFSDPLFFQNFANLTIRSLFAWLSLGVWAWGAGFGVATVARRTHLVNVPALALCLFLGSILLARGPAISQLPYYFAIPALLMVTCCTLLPALHGASHANRQTVPSATAQALLLACILAPILSPMEFSFGGYFAQTAPAFVWGRNLPGLLAYWPVAYWVIQKWDRVHPNQDHALRS